MKPLDISIITGLIIATSIEPFEYKLIGVLLLMPVFKIKEIKQ